MSKLIISKLNNQAEKNRHEFIEKSEEKYFKQLASIIKDAVKNKVKFIFVSGPSSSGKTTTAKYLCAMIESYKKHSNYVSLDDFFKNREDTPLLADGNKDYESLNALDIDEMKKCFSDLLQNGVANFPQYNFFTGINTKNVNKIRLTENSIFVIEGNHAFNPVVNQCVDGQKFIRVFVHPEHEFVNDEKETVIDVYTLRLIRRTIRDVGNRGYKPEHTFKMWNMVRDGEIKYIYPYKHLADYVINTTYNYEVMVYKTILGKLLKNAQGEVSKQLLKIVEPFAEIDVTQIPKNSLMWEFLSNLKI